MLPFAIERVVANRPLMSNALGQSVPGVVSIQPGGYDSKTRKQKHACISSFMHASRSDSFRQVRAALLICVSVFGVLAAKGDWNLRLSLEIRVLALFGANRPLTTHALGQSVTADQPLQRGKFVETGTANRKRLRFQ
jgi:hypothetical protein